MPSRVTSAIRNSTNRMQRLLHDLQTAANLLSNARHHGDGAIHLGLSLQDGHARLCIRNPAAPIAAELVDGQFGPFKRTSLKNARNPGSLGLYIVDQVAKAHGGTIRYEPGEGVVSFVLQLPL
jgi:signal transduction histidine kinase